ncbi:hypothetical protein Pmani_011272 [Petrolisthes manimaculis]|uniref:Regulatory protein zeste n=1 Tax=Petrolisthes manimaculis TaxID=1843537 RepID=A0AAE1Q1F4_9EUCA|nr:hypothetical protein Pmani_011272 [Petrolisthes manimaculis]
MERSSPLSETQRRALLSLIKEMDSIVNDKSTSPPIVESKKKTWEEISVKFNALYPDNPPRSTKQLKRSYDHVKRKVKEERKFKKKIKVTGGGCPPTPPNAPEEIALVASMMTVDLAMGDDVFETFTLEPVHKSSAADVYELRKEDVDDPGVPGVSGNSYGNPAYPTHPSESLDPVPLPVASASTSSSSSSPTPRSPAIITATPHHPLNPSTPSLGSVTKNCPHSKNRYSAKDDAYLQCRTRQEEYHRLKIAQMQEMHAREIEYMNQKISFITSVHSKVTEVLASAKRAFDAMGPLDDV